MPDIIIDGKVRIGLVASISNRNSPTVAELNAGTDVSTIVTPDGLVGFAAETAPVDSSAINSTFNTQLPGRASFSGTGLRLKKQAATGDTVYNLLVREYATNIVVRRGIASATAWTAGQAVEVYPIICGQQQEAEPEANSVQKYFVPTFINPEPSTRATVA